MNSDKQEMAEMNKEKKQSVEKVKGMNLKEAKKAISSAQRLHEAEQKLLKMQGEVAQALSILRALVEKMSEFQTKNNNTATAVVGLNQKVNSIMSVLDNSNVVKQTVIEEEIVQQKIKAMTDKVGALKEKNIIKDSDGVVKETSFVVMEERAFSGELVSPRTQVILAALNEEVRAKLLGAKIGDTVSLGENKNSISVLEVYDLVENKSAEDKAEGNMSDEEIEQMEKDEQTQGAQY